MAKPVRPIVEIAPKTWLVSEYKLVNTYLLEGTERAILIDAGTAVGDLAADVRDLTDKPIDVVVTHGDGDHTAAAGCFGKAYLHPLDKHRGEMFKEMGDARAMARFCVTTRGPVRNPETPIEDLMALIPAEPLPEPTYEYIEEGYVFDLGGRTLEVIHTPGHSDGSICLLDKENRLLFTGDACNDRLLVAGEDLKAGLQTSYDSFKKMWARESEFDYICQGHDALDKSDKSFITDYIEAIDLLIAGKAAGVPTTDAMHSGTMYKHGKVMVWYDLNLFAKKDKEG